MPRIMINISRRQFSLLERRERDFGRLNIHRAGAVAAAEVAPDDEEVAEGFLRVT